MSQATEVKEDRRYTKEHEWARIENGEVVVGVTAFAVDQLGDVTLVNFDVKPGDQVQAGQIFGTIESVKTLSDLFAPVAGRVVRLNAELEKAPESVNEDCWGKGWMLVIQPSDAVNDAALMDASAYREHIASLET